MVIGVSIAAWALTMLLVGYLGWILKPLMAGQKRCLAVYGILLAVGVGVWFRPHETILAGEDPGSYIHSAATYAREGRLFYRDPALSRVPVDARGGFFLGHAGYGWTKDGSLNVRDLEAATIGPKFQPLYPIVSVPAARLAPRAILYVVPLFTVLAAFALGCLAGQVFRTPWAGAAAMLFYMTCPLIAWHARAPRPEIMASFFLLAGYAVLLHAVTRTGREAFFGLVLGATAMMVAPFLHITAWLVVVPSAGVALSMIMTGRRRVMIGLPVALIGGILFMWQILNVVDTYALARYARPVWQHLVWLVLVCCLGMALLPWLSKQAGNRFQTSGIILWAARRQGVLSFLGTALIVGLCLWLYGRRLPIALRSYTGPVYHYVYPTDLRVAVAFLSRPVAVAGLIGLGWMVLVRTHRARTVPFLLCFLPAACAIGNLYDFFMSRYLVVAFLPLLMMALTALVLLAWRHGGRRRILYALMCAALLAGLQVRNRRHLFTVVNHEGLLSFVQGFAERMTGRKPLLLGEYTRLVAPVEHLFGVPTLSLDNETRFDYRTSIKTWRDLVARRDDQPVYFLTPYAPPVAEGLAFELAHTATLQYPSLPNARWGLPGPPATNRIRLSLYEVSLEKAAGSSDLWVRPVQAGNMGLLQFSRYRVKNWRVDGTWLREGRPCHIQRAGPVAGGASPSSLWLFFLNTAGDAIPAPRVTVNGLPVAHAVWRPLFGDWWLFGCPSIPPRAQVQLTPVAADLLLSDAWWGDAPSPAPGVVRGAEINGESGRSSFSGRWARAESHFLVPHSGGSTSWLALLVRAPEASGSSVRVTLSAAGQEVGSHAVPAGRWTWQAWRLPSGGDPGLWMRMRVTPSWDPERGGYPDDLGVRVAGFVAWDAAGLPVAPSPTRPLP